MERLGGECALSLAHAGKGTYLAVYCYLFLAAAARLPLPFYPFSLSHSHLFPAGAAARVLYSHPPP